MDINKVLERSPSEIALRAEKAEKSRFLWKEAELRLKQMEAEIHLRIKAEYPDKTVADLKAVVDNDDSIYQQRMAVICHESEYKKECIELDKWINAFNSARKLANIRIEEMRNLNSSVK